MGVVVVEQAMENIRVRSCDGSEGADDGSFMWMQFQANPANSETGNLYVGKTREGKGRGKTRVGGNGKGGKQWLWS